MSIILAALGSLAACAPSAPALSVEQNLQHHEVVIRTAAITLPAADGHAGHYGYQAHTVVTPITPFAWPVDGWARGFRLRLRDCAGNELPNTRLHHAVVLHLEQRELLYPIYERLLAFTQESEDITLPRGAGMRIAKGARLGLLAAWMPVASEPEQVVLELTIPYLAGNTVPRPVDVLPLGFDVNYEPGGGASFDLPPGRTTLAREFVLPMDGHVLLAGGHLHDYATAMTLTDAESGRTVIDVTPERDAAGHLRRVSRKVYGAAGDGLALKAGRRYRLTVTYDNPASDTLRQAGMGILGSIFSPADLRRWPALDQADPGFTSDVAMFVRTGFLVAQPGLGATRPR